MARPVTMLTVDEAVKRALDSNIELNVERLNPTVQELAWRQIRAAYTPTLGSTLNANAANPLPTSLLNGGTNVTNQTANYNINVTQALPWNGSSFTAAFNNQRTNTTSTFATLNPQYTTQVTGTFNQPLLRNFKIDTTRNSLMAAQITREITDVTLRRVVINTIAATRNAYWDLVAAIRAIAAAKQSLELAQKLVEDNQTRVEVGTLAPMDVISAQAEAATRQQTLTTAEATRRTAELVLKRLIVPNTDDPLWKTTIEPTEVVKIEPDADQPRSGRHGGVEGADGPGDGAQEPPEHRHQHPLPEEPDAARPRRHGDLRHPRPRRQHLHPRARRGDRLGPGRVVRRVQHDDEVRLSELDASA